MSAGKDKGSVVRKLERNGLLIGVNPCVIETHYEVVMGSTAYGVANNTSDMDMYGMYCPTIDYIFPEAAGIIRGFGPQLDFSKVDNFQRHHIQCDNKEYDLALYSIIRYFDLCMDNNPNMIDSLFVPDRCVVHIDTVGEIIRENRRLFLHKGIHKKLMGYAFGQFKRIRSQTREGKRVESIEKFGYDVKNAYHIVRLVQQAEMVMTTHDLDLEENRELLKTVRRGEWTIDRLEKWFETRQTQLDMLYVSSDLRLTPDVDTIRTLLMQCLEAKFGSLSAYFNIEGSDKIAQDKLAKIKAIVNS
jgi:predicted nucleotidyltransferase